MTAQPTNCDDVKDSKTLRLHARLHFSYVSLPPGRRREGKEEGDYCFNSLAMYLARQGAIANARDCAAERVAEFLR